jgi:hypothetical protein
MRAQLDAIRQQLTAVHAQLANTPAPPQADAGDGDDDDDDDDDDEAAAAAAEALLHEMAAFMQLATSFVAAYVKEIRPWVNSVQRSPPVMRGLGPATTVVLDAHSRLAEVREAWLATVQGVSEYKSIAELIDPRMLIFSSTIDPVSICQCPYSKCPLKALNPLGLTQSMFWRKGSIAKSPYLFNWSMSSVIDCMLQPNMGSQAQRTHTRAPARRWRRRSSARSA